MNCTKCGDKAASSVSLNKWQCQWSSVRLVFDIQGHMQVYTLCNDTTRHFGKGDCK